MISLSQLIRIGYTAKVFRSQLNLATIYRFCFSN